MSPTGSPDFNQNPAANNASPSFDSAEDTTRLLMGGGAQSRAGRWIFASGFEDGLGEVVPSTGTSSIESGVGNVFQGANCLKITTLATTDSLGGWNKYLFTQGQNYGLEEIFSLHDLGSGTKEITLIISGVHADPGFRASGTIVLVVTGVNAANLYLDVNGTRTLISNLDNYLSDSSDFWHYWKIVFNPYTNLVSRVYFDDQVFTINSPGYKQAQTFKYVRFLSQITTKAAVVAIGYIDNIIMTTDEP